MLTSLGNSGQISFSRFGKAERRGPGRSPSPGPRSAVHSATLGSERALQLTCAGSTARFSDHPGFSRNLRVAGETSRGGVIPRSDENYNAADSVTPTVTGRCGVIWRPWPRLNGFPKAKVSLNESKGFNT